MISKELKKNEQEWREEVAFPDQTVQLYKIADVSADFQYTLAEPFEATGLILNGIQTNGEWNEIRSTLEASWKRPVSTRPFRCAPAGVR